MVRWRSFIQLKEESSLEGRKELVLDGVKKGMKGWFRFTMLYIFIALIILTGFMIVVNLVGP